MVWVKILTWLSFGHAQKKPTKTAFRKQGALSYTQLKVAPSTSVIAFSEFLSDAVVIFMPISHIVSVANVLAAMGVLVLKQGSLLEHCYLKAAESDCTTA